MHKLKYLNIFVLAATIYIALTNYGIWTYLPLLFTFVAIPLFELLFKPNRYNLSELEKEKAKNDKYFSFVLYAVVPIQVFLLYLFLESVQDNLTTSDLVGRVIAFGISCGIFGINAGHELGHRSNRFEQLLGEILLLTSLETHFLPYHNSGHHYHVATPKDPASSRKGETVFAFWFRSQFGSYIQAWQIESRKLKKKKVPFISIYNRMLVYTFLQILLLFTIYTLFNFNTVILFGIASAIGIILLETVNYIEHYGLVRKQNENGNYERVQPYHSWNSDHVVGRTLLFELSRHSDHHYRASKHYQILDSMPNSPQMITGYPGMMLLSLIPPLWFKIMHRELEKFKKSSSS
ncbi:alkane 1-monooxygenase [Lutibacter sp.]